MWLHEHLLYWTTLWKGVNDFWGFIVITLSFYNVGPTKEDVFLTPSMVYISVIFTHITNDKNFTFSWDHIWSWVVWYTYVYYTPASLRFFFLLSLFSWSILKSFSVRALIIHIINEWRGLHSLYGVQSLYLGTKLG